MSLLDRLNTQIITARLERSNDEADRLARLYFYLRTHYLKPSRNDVLEALVVHLTESINQTYHSSVERDDTISSWTRLLYKFSRH